MIPEIPSRFPASTREDHNSPVIPVNYPIMGKSFRVSQTLEGGSTFHHALVNTLHALKIESLTYQTISYCLITYMHTPVEWLISSILAEIDRNECTPPLPVKPLLSDRTSRYQARLGNVLSWRMNFPSWVMISDIIIALWKIGFSLILKVFCRKNI